MLYGFTFVFILACLDYSTACVSSGVYNIYKSGSYYGGTELEKVEELSELREADIIEGIEPPENIVTKLREWLDFHRSKQKQANQQNYYENSSLHHTDRGPGSNWPWSWQGIGDGYKGMPLTPGQGSGGGGGGGGSGPPAFADGTAAGTGDTTDPEGGGGEHGGDDHYDYDDDDDQIYDESRNPGGLPAYCFTKTPGEYGTCNDTLVRWSYYTNLSKCRSFNYSGCDGNENNFLTELICEQTCILPPAPKGCDPMTNIYVPEYGILEHRRSGSRRCD